MVTARDVTKFYGLHRAVDRISFDLHPGEVLGFLGPNGAGKTTTMKMLTCFLAPSAGSIKVKGLDVSEEPLRVRQMMGYLPENAPLYPDMTVMGFLRFCAEVRGITGRERDMRVSRSAEQCGIADRMRDPIGILSKGLRQRVGLAQAILPDPEILILDEPTSGLDPNQIVEIRGIVRELGRTKTVILSTHILSEVELTCGRAIIVNQGKVVADASLDELRSRLRGERRRYLFAVGPGAGGAPPAEAYVRDRLKSLSWVEDVAPVDRGPGEPPTWAILAGTTNDLRPELFRLATDQKWSILELHRDLATLEQVFLRLTQEDLEPLPGN
ncbi:MAG: ATP-binding cassette domain-containing protein [Deltaproteobacteria bacterium]|nr:ATP-binding cassette domain-containing protein [Deltaproteobacteria bacterium]